MEEEHKVSQLWQEGAFSPRVLLESGKKGDGAKNMDQVHANVEGDDDEEEGENIFVQNKKSVVDKNYLLLNNQSTVNEVANASLLKNIKKVDKPIIVHCNAGSMRTNLVGEHGKMTLHHNPNSIADVLSLKSVATRHRETYDSHDRGGVFQVYTPFGVVEFKPSEQGRHYLDMSENG
jgi:hypothetical protein